MPVREHGHRVVLPQMMTGRATLAPEVTQRPGRRQHPAPAGRRGGQTLLWRGPTDRPGHPGRIIVVPVAQLLHLVQDLACGHRPNVPAGGIVEPEGPIQPGSWIGSA